MSILNKKWLLLNDSKGDILEILFSNRTIDDIDSFLNPKYEKLYDPFLMKDMDIAVEKLIDAKKKNHKILIYGDYDVDGITSSVLLKNALDKLGIESETIIPDRVNDGYGLNMNCINILKDKKIDLLITVDNGISAIDEIKKIREENIEVIIMDHHQPHEVLPDAIILNPLRNDCTYPNKHLCGAGIVFKFIQALGIKIPDIIDQTYIKWELDLVALGTICDVAKLVGENRILTKYGLIVIKNSKKIGLKNLIKLSQVISDPTSFDIGYKVGPRLNASGRLENGSISFDLLYSKDESVTTERSFLLQELNVRRQEIVKSMMMEAYSIIDNSKKYILVKKNDWHPGVIGLLASTISQEFQKPTFVLCESNNFIVGSVRTPKIKLDIMEAMHHAKDIFLKYGGHSSASGLKMEEKYIDNFISLLDVFFKENVNQEDLEVNLDIDLEIDHQDFTIENIEKIKKLEPFGEGNPEPIFMLKKFQIKRLNLVGDKKTHMKIEVSNGDKSFNGIAFNFGKYLYEMEQMLKEEKFIDIAFRPSINEWNGNKKAELNIIDLRIHE